MHRREMLLLATYDAEADAAYVYLTDAIPDGGSARSPTVDDPELRDGVFLDVNHDGEVVGVGLLGADLLSPYLRRFLVGSDEET
jgi:uncharacterized protein YuzE